MWTSLPDGLGSGSAETSNSGCGLLPLPSAISCAFKVADVVSKVTVLPLIILFNGTWKPLLACDIPAKGLT